MRSLKVLSTALGSLDSAPRPFSSTGEEGGGGSEPCVWNVAVPAYWSDIGTESGGLEGGQRITRNFLQKPRRSGCFPAWPYPIVLIPLELLFCVLASMQPISAL